MERWLREVGLLAPAAQQEPLRRTQRSFLTYREQACALEATLSDHGLVAAVPGVEAHIRARRPPVDEVEAAVRAAGFELAGRTDTAFALRFASAAALFSHWLIRVGFLEPWRETVPAAEREAVFADVARRLDALVAPGEGLRLDVPCACWTAVRAGR